MGESDTGTDFRNHRGGDLPSSHNLAFSFSPSQSLSLLLILFLLSFLLLFLPFHSPPSSLPTNRGSRKLVIAVLGGTVGSYLFPTVSLIF